MLRQPRLGKVQLRIMRVLWERGRATAREITDALSLQESIAHSTVQTLLRKMEAKGAVRHVTDDRTFVFLPLYKEDEVTESATQDLVSGIFQGSVFGLVSHLLKHEKISPDEMRRIRDLIDSGKPNRAVNGEEQ
jgi:BlaI family transcriptional regulator, penicillinase repressor